MSYTDSYKISKLKDMLGDLISDDRQKKLDKLGI